MFGQKTGWWSGNNSSERGLKEDDQKLDTKVGLKVGRWLKFGQWLKVGQWLRTLIGCRIPSDWQGLLPLQLCTLGVHCSEVGWSSVFPLASRVLTHRRSRDFSSISLDHDLSHGQQVVFQSLELQEVPISPQRLSSCFYQQVNHRKTWALTQVKLTTGACNMQHFLSDALCISRSYLRNNLPERPTLSRLDRNLTWPTAGQCQAFEGLLLLHLTQQLRQGSGTFLAERATSGLRAIGSRPLS